MNKEILKNNLKVFRAKRDLTQAELALKIGVSRKTVNTIENGVFVPSTLLALKLARFFGEPVEDIFLYCRRGGKVINKLVQVIKRNANGKNVLICFSICLFVIVMIYTKMFGLLPIDYTKGTFDNLWYYPSAYLYDTLDNHGETGRRSYLLFHLMDYVYIPCWACVWGFLLSMLIGKFPLLDRRLDFLVLIPLIYGVMDYLENIFIDLTILFYPDRIFFSRFCGGLTLIKKIPLFFSYVLVLILALASILVHLSKKLRGNRNI